MYDDKNICLELEDGGYEYYPVAPEIVQTSN